MASYSYTAQGGGTGGGAAPFGWESPDLGDLSCDVEGAWLLISATSPGGDLPVPKYLVLTGSDGVWSTIYDVPANGGQEGYQIEVTLYQAYPTSLGGYAPGAPVLTFQVVGVRNFIYVHFYVGLNTDGCWSTTSPGEFFVHPIDDG